MVSQHRCKTLHKIGFMGAGGGLAVFFFVLCIGVFYQNIIYILITVQKGAVFERACRQFCVMMPEVEPGEYEVAEVAHGSI